MPFVTLSPTERGVLNRYGAPSRWLGPGRHWLWSGQVQRIDLTQGAVPWSAELEALLPAGVAERVDVPAAHRGLLQVDGLPCRVLPPGRWLVWQSRCPASVEVVDTNDISTPIPSGFVELVEPSMRNSVVIRDGQRGLLTQRGRLVALLEPGEHWLWWTGTGNAVLATVLQWTPWTPQLEAILSPHAAEILAVPVGQLALVSADGVPCAVLGPGRYVLWQLHQSMSAELHSAEAVHTTIPPRWWGLMPSGTLREITVSTHERALLYIDGTLSEVLQPGRYGIHTQDRQVRVEMVALWEQELQITGQEVMTADKVSLRINIIVHYQITDPILATEGSASAQTAVYSEVQLVARRFVAGVTVDELLEKRGSARQVMLAQLAGRAEALGVRIAGVDLKDVVLPGEMKTIFNQVISAQKRAAANVITRREETAATRSLANTARMLENNPTLLKLKELEALKELADRVGTVNIVATPDELLGRMKLSE